MINGKNEPDWTPGPEGEALTPAQIHQQNLDAAFADSATEEQELSVENIHLVNYIQSRRIYDALLVLIDHFDSEAADSLVAAHEAGHFVSPEPSIAAEGEE